MGKAKLEFIARITTEDGREIERREVQEIPTPEEVDTSSLEAFMESFNEYERSALEARITNALPEINKEIPNYAKIKKVEFMPEDFERTPKRSIKRYLYQRNGK